MRTRSQARRRRQPQVRQTSVESSNLEKPDNPPIVAMADNRTMAQLLEAPTEGYEDAIVIPEITANNFEIKHGLLNLVQNKQFFGNDKEDPHAHIRYFNKITSTMKIPNVPNTSVKLMLFPFSLEGAARIWLEKEPPRSIETWDDLVSKFINKFFPPSKTTNLRNEITRFQQKFDETFYEAWDRFNDLLRGCPHHGFSELHQLDTFYNALNSNDQDSLNSAAGGNFLDKMPRECLKIIESKSKVRQSRNKAVVAKMSTSSSTQAVSSDVAELKDMVRALILDRKNQTPASAPVKAVEQSCVTCGGATEDVILLLLNSIRYPNPVGPLLLPSVTPVPKATNSISYHERNDERFPKKIETLPILIPCDLRGLYMQTIGDLGASIIHALFCLEKISLFLILTTNLHDVRASRIVQFPPMKSIGIAKRRPSYGGKVQFQRLRSCDFETDPRVPCFLGRCFLKKQVALIDVYGGEITSVIGKDSH
ncbi:reverse transcriptase domain-containing protein [Tanacetum coccineum]